MAIDLIQWIVFCSCRCGRAACATSSAVHGSVGLRADVQKQRAVRPSARAAACTH